MLYPKDNRGKSTLRPWSSKQKLLSFITNTRTERPVFNIVTPNLNHNIETKLFLLPVELLHHIATFLPLSSQASLALTSHAALSLIGLNLFKTLKSRVHKKERVNLLRLLRKDHPTPPSHWLCHSCATFHKTSPLGLLAPPRPYPEDEIDNYDSTCGQPACQVPMVLPHVYIADSVDKKPRKTNKGPRIDAHSAFYWHGYAHPEDSAAYALNMEYKIFPRIAGVKFLVYTSYRATSRGRIDTEALESLNLDICPHLGLGSDWYKGDNSLMDKLVHVSRQYGGTSHVCGKCWLECDIRFESLAFGCSAVTVDVFRDLGWVKPPVRGAGGWFVLKKGPVAEAAVPEFKEFNIGEIREAWTLADVDNLKPPQYGSGCRGPFGAKYVHDDGAEPVWVSRFLTRRGG
jgi:hypothetical protein